VLTLRCLLVLALITLYAGPSLAGLREIGKLDYGCYPAWETCMRNGVIGPHCKVDCMYHGYTNGGYCKRDAHGCWMCSCI